MIQNFGIHKRMNPVPILQKEMDQRPDQRKWKASDIYACRVELCIINVAYLSQ